MKALPFYLQNLKNKLKNVASIKKSYGSLKMVNRFLIYA